jgi:hypothetical protein
VANPEELEVAVQGFYPNALADLHSVGRGSPPVTDYRAFTNRQTGMYRITTFLDDVGVGQLLDRVCNTVCLKTRLWPIQPSNPCGFSSKVFLPCLEPCTIFLEAARKEVRVRQENSARAGQAESASEGD